MRRVSLLLLSLALAGCAGAPPSGPDQRSTPNPEAAAQQARTFATIATTNSWGNYGEQFTRFCEKHFGFDCNRPERSKGEDLLSAQEIQAWDAEKNNPQSVLADIGSPFIDQAAEAGILADYQPPNASLLPEGMYGDGWVTTFVGVPSWAVNVGFLESRNIPVPETWADLADPVYAGMVGLNRVGVSGGGTWSFVAMNLAAGGTMDDFGPGLEYGRRLLPNIGQQATMDTFERGEVPIWIRYDFNHIANMATFEERGIDYRIVIPSDGSVYAPSVLMMNRYDTGHHDFAKMFMEWVLTCLLYTSDAADE